MGIWFASALFWSLFFAPRGWNVFNWASGLIDAARYYSVPKHRPIILALFCIMVIGASIRLTQLDTLPPEMLHSDHRIAIVGAYKISQGQWPIMYEDWQAVESMHYYLTAAFAKLTGLGFDHYTLKLVAAFESLITLPVLFWMGVELMGRQNRKFGLAMGLMVSGLVAVSFWHVAITRYALRTHLTTLFAALVMIFIVRAMRDNRRSDFILLGLLLGYAVYAYTACRILPGAAAAGIGLALLLRRRPWRERLLYLGHSAIAGFIFLLVLLPWYRFSLDYPFLANRQVAGNVLGIAPGEPIEIDPDAFLTGLMGNYRDALLVFNFVGDHRIYHGIPYEPSLDVYTGAFLVLGLAAWFRHTLKSRQDPVWWFLPLLILIMMLPTTLSIAAPEDNPSNTRLSGAIPAIHLLAALPIVAIAYQLARSLPRRLGKVSAVAFCILVLLLANQSSASMLFNDWAARQENPSLSFRHIGKTLQGITDSDVPWGNVVMIAGPGFHVDHRNVFISAGNPEFTAAPVLDDVIAVLDQGRNRRDDYRLDPDRDLVFFYSPTDEDSARKLLQWFPNGTTIEIFGPDYMTGSYLLMRVPYPRRGWTKRGHRQEHISAARRAHRAMPLPLARQHAPKDGSARR